MLIHSHSHDARDEAVEAARAAGQMGATRLPASVLFTQGQELSDTTIVRCVTALEEGQSERDRAKALQAYLKWLASNREQLGDEIEAAMAQGCTDVDGWLKGRFQQVTGMRL